MHGTATVAVTAQDDGGTANGGVDTSASQTFVITVNSAIDTAIDVKPGSDVNPGKLGSRGVLPVAMLSTQKADGKRKGFDATTIDTSTIMLNKVATHPFHAAFEDADGDGDLDLMLHFRMPELVDESVLDENSTALFVVHRSDPPGECTMSGSSGQLTLILPVADTYPRRLVFASAAVFSAVFVRPFRSCCVCPCGTTGNPADKRSNISEEKP